MNNALPIQEDANKLFPAHIKAFIFDLDGTLADTMPAHYKACQIVGEKYGFVFPEAFFYECAGMPTTAAFDLLFKKKTSPWTLWPSDLKRKLYTIHFYMK